MYHKIGPARLLVAHAMGHMRFDFCAEDDSSLTEEEKALARFQRQRMKELTGKYRGVSCEIILAVITADKLH